FAPEPFGPPAVGFLSPHPPFPFRLFLKLIPPRDKAIMRRVVAAIFDHVCDGVVDIRNERPVERNTRHSREHALGDTIGRIWPAGVAELRNDVAMANDQTVRGSPLGRDRTEQLSEDDLLV